jgi:LPXTG-motif cell wall-anchored protein
MQDLPKIAAWEEKQAVQKLPATGSNDPISLSIFGIGLVSFVTMLGLTLRRALQPATIPTNSGGLGLDMPMMEMKSQDSHKISSSRVGWGQLSSQNTHPSTLCYAMETQEDLKSLAKQLNPTVGYWDPLSIGEEGTSLWNYNNERKIAWFRQAEIKHGRVAMAAFVGYCVQANGGPWSFKMTLGGADWPTGTPPEQWDALPQASKWQIILFVGLLEAFDESTPPHYTNGRKPGQFPSFKGTAIKEKGLTPFDLYDPFGFSKNASPEKKSAGLAR